MASNSGGTWSFLKLAWSLLKFFDGAWSLLKFLWSMVVSQILAKHGHINFWREHGRFSNFCGARLFLKFLWSMVVSQIVVEHGRY